MTRAVARAQQLDPGEWPVPAIRRRSNWLVHERAIEPHIPVFDKSQRTDGTFSRENFA